MADAFDLPTLRFITCGSVDDGKSSLLGRLLFESRNIFEDEQRAIDSDSRRFGTQGERTDLALLVDGLQAEREQGITIDVAYRYFATPRRRFIAADTPGHEQYTRNMATGASTAQLAIILVDARKGLLTQTRRHSRIVGMMGIRNVVLAVNKMDLVGYSQRELERIASAYRGVAAACGIEDAQVIPVSALEGDNVVARSEAMGWYRGPTLLEYLESAGPTDPGVEGPLRLPVQWINRPSPGIRCVCGRIAAGALAAGDPVRVWPSGAKTRVSRIIGWRHDLPRAEAGESVAIVLEGDLDVSRGNVITSLHAGPAIADQFGARLLWMHADEMVPGRAYGMKIHHQEVTATVALEYREDVDTGERQPAKTLGSNDIGMVVVSTSAPVVFDAYASNRTTGGFILIDKLTRETIAAGMMDETLRRSSNSVWQPLSINQEARASQKLQRARCVWLTGLSGAGKSTIANALEKRLFADGRHTYILDGDNLRHGLNKDLGYSVPDRVENVRRVAEVARLMVDAGLIVIVAFIAPFRAERRMARELFGDGEFIEVFVDAPLEVCEKRDTKGLYARARRGDLRDFTGIDSPYEAPEAPEVHLDAARTPVESCVEQILPYLD